MIYAALFAALGFAAAALALAIRVAGLIGERGDVLRDLDAAIAEAVEHGKVRDAAVGELNAALDSRTVEVLALRTTIEKYRSLIEQLPASEVASELILEALAAEHGFILVGESGE